MSKRRAADDFEEYDPETLPGAPDDIGILGHEFGDNGEMLVDLAVLTLRGPVAIITVYLDRATGEVTCDDRQSTPMETLGMLDSACTYARDTYETALQEDEAASRD